MNGEERLIYCRDCDYSELTDYRARVCLYGPVEVGVDDDDFCSRGRPRENAE